ncbi:hypothetical protein VTK56DRAFT_7737 [Thermocarpiscus australiensis]
MLNRERTDDIAAVENEDQDRRRRKRLRPRRPAALVEQLPTEILERIAFMSENLNFLRSSLRIGYLLSSKSFLTELLAAAFAPTWDQWFGCPRSKVHSYRGFLEDYERIGGSPDFQSAVLACPWANLALLLEAQQIWYRRDGARRYYEHADYALCTPGEPGGLASHPTAGFDHARDVTACFEADWENFLSGLSVVAFTPVVVDSFVATNHRRNSGYIELHPLTKIPERLLSSPLDWEKARWLFWFIRGGARLLPVHTWELTQRGYNHIMTLADKRLALALLWMFRSLGVFDEHWPLFLVDEKLEEAKWQSISHTGPWPMPGMPFNSQQVWWLACEFLESVMGPAHPPLPRA